MKPSSGCASSIRWAFFDFDALDVLRGCEAGERGELAVELAVGHAEAFGHGVNVDRFLVVEHHVDAVGDFGDESVVDVGDEGFVGGIFRLCGCATFLVDEHVEFFGEFAAEDGALFEDFIDASDKFVAVERLGEVSVGSGAKSFEALGFGDFSGDDDDGDVASDVVGSDCAAE